MWIVRLALRRPYTFVVFCAFNPDSRRLQHRDDAHGHLSQHRHPGGHGGVELQRPLGQEMANRIVTNSERGMTTTVNDIEHIESQSLNGLALIKIFFQPHVNIASAVAEITAISQVQLRSLPPGSLPPFIIQYNASSVPILMLGLSGQGLNEQRLSTSAPTPFAPN